MRRKNKHSGDVQVDLPITPMLDMAFQLMAFFILTFRPPSNEEQIVINLPAEQGGPSQVTPDLLESLEPPKEYKLQLSDANGALETVILIDNDGRKTPIDPGPKQVYAKLSSFVVPQGEKPAKLKIEASPELQYGQLMRVMDECIAAGYNPSTVSVLGG